MVDRAARNPDGQPRAADREFRGARRPAAGRPALRRPRSRQHARLRRRRDAQLRLLALDIDAGRLQRIGHGLERLGLAGQAILQAADAAAPDTWWDGAPFDAVLLDAPCTATGVVRRQPDVLVHRRERDADGLAALQARLFDALWPTLAPGGTLVYATCSILRQENARQVEAFLARTPDAAAEPLDQRFGRVDGPGRQRLPGEDGMDGFFVARLRRT